MGEGTNLPTVLRGLPTEVATAIKGLPAELVKVASPTHIASLSVSQAVSGTALRAVEREHKKPVLRQIMFLVLYHTDAMTGGRCTTTDLMNMAVSVSEDYKNYSIETIALALRRGVLSEKVYGKITYDIVSRWINQFNADVIGNNDENHLRHG